jgi:hypothetical protein
MDQMAPWIKSGSLTARHHPGMRNAQTSVNLSGMVRFTFFEISFTRNARPQLRLLKHA